MSAECDGGSGGVGSIGVFLATASVGGSTTAYLAAGLTNLTVGNLSVTANTQHLVTSNTVAAVIGGLAGGGTNSTTTVTEDVEAYLGTPASSTPNTTPSSYTPSGSVTVQATANNDGTAQAIGGLAGRHRGQRQRRQRHGEADGARLRERRRQPDDHGQCDDFRHRDQHDVEQHRRGRIRRYRGRGLRLLPRPMGPPSPPMSAPST